MDHQTFINIYQFYQMAAYSNEKTMLTLIFDMQASLLRFKPIHPGCFTGIPDLVETRV